MGDDDELTITARKAPKPKDELNEMPRGMKDSERPMPLEHEFHVTSIARMPKAKGGSEARPGPKTASNPMKYLKKKQAEQAEVS
jgi:hypothetical protein